MKKNFFLLLLSIFFSISLLEIYFRFNNFPVSGTWRIQDQNGLYLNKTKGSSKHEFKKNTFIQVNYNFSKFNNRKYENIEYEINKPKILILGDSFTFGWLLKDEDTYIYKLQKDFPNYYFVNVASGGWGFSDYASYLENYCKLINPLHTFIFISNITNDLDDSFYSKLYSLENENLLKGKNDISSFKKHFGNTGLYQLILENFYTLQFLRNIFVLSNSKRKENIIDNQRNIKSFNKINQKENENSKFLSLITKEIFASTIKCKTNLSIINLAWDSDKKNNFNYYPEVFEFIKNNLLDLYLLNENLWKNKANFELEEGHPNAKGNQYFYEKVKPFFYVILNK